MVTRIDNFIKEFMVTLMEEDKLDGAAFQNLLNHVRESFGFDVVYTLEKISIDREFTFRFMSVSRQEYNTVGKVITLPPDAYEDAIHMYDERGLCGYNVKDAEEHAISNNVLHYGYVRCNNQVYDGSIGFQQFQSHIWSEEEQEALIKLGRVYGLIFNKELATEINDTLFESLRNEEILKYKADHDALTRILNRRGFEQITCLLKKEQFPLAFAILDIDNFKSVNDTYGHEVGDKILSKTAKLLNMAFRSSDMTFRLGGDEFGIILNNLTYKSKDFITNTIQQMNAALQKPLDGLPAISLSVGVAFSSNGYSDEVFKAADGALYEMKKNGKGGCIIVQTFLQQNSECC